MPHDPERIAETKAWLRKANDDLDIAKELLKPGKALSGGAVFHCQQAAEKALKAFLVWHDVPFRKTHDLKEIGEACAELDATLTQFIGRAVPLTEYAWKFRYPGEPEGPSPEEADTALALATELYKAILARLPKEVEP
jgi:HEPN domain-containing protein